MRQFVVPSPTSVTHLPLEPKNQHDISDENLFMINEEYKENVTHYDTDGFPDAELLIKMWDDVCMEESENFYRLAFNQYYASHPHLHGFYDVNGYELEIVQLSNTLCDVCLQCNKTHYGKYGLENAVFRDYLELTELVPRYDIMPYMPKLDTNGLPVLEYPSRPMFPRLYLGENIEWDHMDGRDKTCVPSLKHVTLMLLVNIQVNPAPYFHLGVLMVEPCEIQFHLYRYTYLPYVEEGGFELYHEKRNKFCVIYATSLHENTLQDNCGYLALLPSGEPINMLYPRYTTYDMQIYMMSDNGTADDEVTEIFPFAHTKPREIIDLTLDDSDSEKFSLGVRPNQLSYDTGSNQDDQHNLFRQHIAEGKALESNLGHPRKYDTQDSPLANTRKRVRDKSPRNAPQNLLLLKRIYRNICPPSEYKPLYPDGRGAIDEPLEIYKGVKLDNDLKFKSVPPKVSRSVCNDIYATNSSSSSNSSQHSAGKEHSLNSLHFLDLAEEMYELADGDIVSPWTNPNEEEAPELLDVPEPRSFREVLDSMAQTVESKFAGFQADIPNHVSAALLSSTDIESLLLYKYRSVWFPTIGVEFST